MDRFGVRKPALRAITRTPDLPAVGRPKAATVGGRDGRVVEWRGARIKNVVGMGEVSAAGLAGESGILVVEVCPGGRASAGGLKAGDVILKCWGQATDVVLDLVRLARDGRGEVTLEVVRDQRPRPLKME